MKKNIFTLCLLLTGVFSNAQVGIGTENPDASAILDVKSSNKGLLPPRVELLNATDVVTIPSPATGLLVYATGVNPANLAAGYYYFDGVKWTSLFGSGPVNATETVYAFTGTYSQLRALNGNKGMKIGEDLYFAYRRPYYYRNMNYNCSDGIWPTLTQTSSANKKVHVTGWGNYQTSTPKQFGYNPGSPKASSFSGNGEDFNGPLNFTPSPSGTGTEIMEPNKFYPMLNGDQVNRVDMTVTLDIFLRVPDEKRFIRLYGVFADDSCGGTATNFSELSGTDFNVLAIEYKFQ